MKVKTLLLSVTLTFAIAGSFWLTSRIHIGKYSAGNPENGPDSYIYQVQVSTTTPQGQLSTYFTSPKLTVYSKKDLTEIEKPKIVVFSDNAPPKKIRADYGKSIGDKSLYLSGHVTITQHKDKEGLTKIKTDYLTFYPQKNMAKTDAPVTILQPNSLTHSVGLVANLKTGAIQLLSNVKITYQPAPSKSSHTSSETRKE